MILDNTGEPNIITEAFQGPKRVTVTEGMRCG